MRDSKKYVGIKRDKERKDSKKKQLFREISLRFHSNKLRRKIIRILRLFSFDIFYVKKENVLALKKSKRFWVMQIFKKWAAYGL